MLSLFHRCVHSSDLVPLVDTCCSDSIFMPVFSIVSHPGPMPFLGITGQARTLCPALTSICQLIACATVIFCSAVWVTLRFWMFSYLYCLAHSSTCLPSCLPLFFSPLFPTCCSYGPFHKICLMTFLPVLTYSVSVSLHLPYCLPAVVYCFPSSL